MAFLLVVDQSGAGKHKFAAIIHIHDLSLVLAQEIHLRGQSQRRADHVDFAVGLVPYHPSNYCSVRGLAVVDNSFYKIIFLIIY